MEACGIQKWLRLMRPLIASEDALLQFHSRTYLDTLRKAAENLVDNDDQELLAEMVIPVAVSCFLVTLYTYCNDRALRTIAACSHRHMTWHV